MRRDFVATLCNYMNSAREGGSEVGTNYRGPSLLHIFLSLSVATHIIR